jgi:hypothetical protein
MSKSTYPAHMDDEEVVYSQASRDLVDPETDWPVTPFSAAPLNYLASVMQSTQQALGAGFGRLADMGVDQDIGNDVFANNMTARTQMEVGTFNGVSGTSVNVNFDHTTSGGSPQRFSAGGLIRVFVFGVLSGSTSTSWRVGYVYSIQNDGSGYPYQFTFKTYSNMKTSDRFAYIAVDGWEGQ